VIGLEMGADDYITKPFDIPVFLARVRALIRRSQVSADGPATRFQCGELVLDVEEHRVSCGKEELDLTPSEFKLLAALMSNQGRVLSRERLIDLVQGQGVAVVDRAIDTHVFGLRKKLGACSEVVETIRGVGYRVRS
jgi:two-component system phosphate regulon response regulator PhoB